MNMALKTYHKTIMKHKWWQKTRFKWALIGSSLSILGPLSEWIFFQIVGMEGSHSLGWAFIFTEIWTFILFTGFGYLLGKSTERVEHIAFHDSLTGIFNRGFLMEQFKELLALHNRYQQEFTVILFDLDFFKKVNDQFGHPVGDQTLVAVANTVKTTCRSSDVFGRFGGEEFLILCPHTSKTEGFHLAERIRQQISSITLEQLGHPGPQTASLGVVTAQGKQETNISSILKNLDQALYQAKSNGRNRVQQYSQTSFQN